MPPVAQKVESIYFSDPTGRGAQEAKLEIIIVQGEGHKIIHDVTLQELIKTLKSPEYNPTLLVLWGMVKQAMESEQLNSESQIAFATIVTQLTVYYSLHL